MKKIQLEVSENNEGTRSPWWVIIDPRQMLRISACTVANMVTGPFFSREEAQLHLGATRYNFSSRAQVWCLSGWQSRQYEEALEK